MNSHNLHSIAFDTLAVKSRSALGSDTHLIYQFQEVFSVSVGNLPPKANVLIKITYVAELPFDGELINFVLPGCVAPWTKVAAMATVIQVGVFVLRFHFGTVL